MKYKPFIIIIPCLNEEAYIKALVEKLAEDNKKLPAQIIIADGKSTDQTPIIAKELEANFDNVHYLENPKRIQSAAINLAVETYGDKAEYLIRIDAHAEYPYDFCQKLIEEAQASKADSVVVSMKTIGKEGFQKAVATAQNSKLGNGGSAHRNVQAQGQWVDHGHHALMRISAFKAVGGYDEDFSHNEDAELDLRLGQAGYKIWLTAKMDMIYYPRSEVKALFKQYFKFGEGRLKTILKHKIKPHLRQMIPVGVAPAVALFIVSPIYGMLAIPALIWALICLGYGIKLGLDNNENIDFLSGAAAMIMHLAWSLGFWKGALSNANEIPDTLRAILKGEVS